MVAVALVESGFRSDVGLPTEPTIAPALRGAGIWMFIPATARNYGLSAQTLAAYNQGEREVDRAVGKAGSRDPFALAKQGYRTTTWRP